MSQCEMCGKEGGLVSAIVEGSSMQVCQKCARFGKIVRPPVGQARQFISSMQKKEVPEQVLLISEDVGSKIRLAREKSGVSQEEFAKRLNEKVSIIQKIESGHMKPSLDLAKKLEKELKTKLIIEHSEESKEEENQANKKSSMGLTIGDILKEKLNASSLSKSK